MDILVYEELLKLSEKLEAKELNYCMILSLIKDIRNDTF